MRFEIRSVSSATRARHNGSGRAEDSSACLRLEPRFEGLGLAWKDECGWNKTELSWHLLRDPVEVFGEKIFFGKL